MDDTPDPMQQFFPDQEVDLYHVLGLESKTVSTEDIRKAYRKQALLNHPDKHVVSSEKTKLAAATKFQQVSFAYAILSDEKRRKKYDKTGQTREGFDIEGGADGWDAYFEEMFERVSRVKLDEMKKEYQGSTEERQDLQKAYNETKGSIAEIMTHIPFSTIEDEPRFVSVIQEMIHSKELPDLKSWHASIKDDKSKAARKRVAKREAQEAEKAAKELGLWDEFYGSGKKGDRKGKGKANDEDQHQGGEDHSALQALILAKQKKREGIFDNLAAKYADVGSGTPKKRKNKADSNSPAKRVRGDPPAINDEEFAQIQEKLSKEKLKKKRS